MMSRGLRLFGDENNEDDDFMNQLTEGAADYLTRLKSHHSQGNNNKQHDEVLSPEALLFYYY